MLEVIETAFQTIGAILLVIGFYKVFKKLNIIQKIAIVFVVLGSFSLIASFLAGFFTGLFS